MSKKTAAAAEAPALELPEVDRTSDAVLVYFVGPKSTRNAPHRDLTHNDVARLAYREALAEVVNDVGRELEDGTVVERPDHKAVDQAKAREIVTDLVSSGYFSLEEPATPATEPETSDEPTEPTQPATPATQPEV